LAFDESPPYQMNLSAVFTEDPNESELLVESFTNLISAILNDELTENHFSIEDKNSNQFFQRALRNLSSTGDEKQLAPLVLKSFSPDNGETYLITVAFMKKKDQTTQIYRILEFHAYPVQGGYQFKSPFEYNNRNLNRFDSGSVQYHYSKALDTDRTSEFVEFKDHFESLVGIPTTQLDYYCFETLDELLRAHGIVYDCTRCNWLKEDLGFLDNNGKSFITGTGDERYIFEYLVDYMVEYCDSENDLYPPFVYGIATYFGDYGLSGDDMQMLKFQFRQELENNPEINFLDEFSKGRSSSVQRHFSFYVISAFICEEVVKKQGYESMLKLAHSGRSGEEFFNNLDELLKIQKDAFHDFIVRLITS
ncbi:MAG: hypothetical protein P1U42_08740, partial [Phycisphaerales bacterium]|nr:hypothetical protein [Phycisphaerales bacterium]